MKAITAGMNITENITYREPGCWAVVQFLSIDVSATPLEAILSRKTFEKVTGRTYFTVEARHHNDLFDVFLLRKASGGVTETSRQKLDHSPTPR